MPVRKGSFMIISRTKIGNVKEKVIMAEITEKQFHAIKHGDDIILKNYGRTSKIAPEQVYCFGNIDFSKGSDDLETIDTFNWFDHLMAKGVSVPSDYDYDTHTCLSPLKTYRYYETFKPSIAARYAHAFLGKPKYTIIYKE